MIECRIVNFLLKIFPFRKGRDFLLKSHIQKCPVCQEKLVEPHEVRSLFIRKEDKEEMAPVWTLIKERLREEPIDRKTVFPHKWGWAWGVAAFTAGVFLGVYFLWISPENSIRKESPTGFQVKYIRVENKPARAFVYHPRDTKMVIVWVEKSM